MAQESRLEQACRASATAKGYFLLKWTGENGVPDRILITPWRIIFMEFKAPTGQLSAPQKIWRDRIMRLGHDYRVIRTREEFEAAL